jgi:hypothetical protein
LGAEPNHLSYTNGAFEHHVINEGRDARSSGMPLGADGRANVDPCHDLATEDRAAKVCVWRQDVLGHFGERCGS